MLESVIDVPGSVNAHLVTKGLHVNDLSAGDKGRATGIVVVVEGVSP